jgi:hypothetical protein
MGTDVRTDAARYSWCADSFAVAISGLGTLPR